MTAPVLRWYDGAALVAAPQTLGPVTPGSTSAEVTLDYWNDKGAVATADTAYNRAFQLLVKDADGNYVSEGVEAVDNHWFEVQASAGLGELTLSAGPWEPLGAGRWLDVPTLVSDAGVRYKFRLNVPGAPNTTTTVEWALSPYRRGSRPLPQGLHEAVGPGINMGIGDGLATWLLRVSGNVVENPAAADAFVEVQDISWVAAGIPYNVVSALLEFTNLDSAAAALVAGEAYYGLVYAKSDGTIAIAKGAKTATPGPDDKPATPAGGLAIAYVLREFDGLVNNADIENVYVQGAAYLTSSGLTATIGPFQAITDSRITETETQTTAALTASETNRIWLKPDGSLAVTITATPPESRAMLLWEAVTDGSAVTSSTDRRPFYAFGYRVQRLDFRFDATLAGAQKQRIAYTNNRTGYILPLGGIAMYLLDNGDTSGATTIDVNLRAPGGAFTTVFTSQGTEDRRPSLAHDSTDLHDVDAFPEVLAVPAHSLLEVEVDAVPGGSITDWMNVVILIACPG